MSNTNILVIIMDYGYYNHIYDVETMQFSHNKLTNPPRLLHVNVLI